MSERNFNIIALSALGAHFVYIIFLVTRLVTKEKGEFFDVFDILLFSIVAFMAVFQHLASWAYAYEEMVEKQNVGLGIFILLFFGMFWGILTAIATCLAF